ncbi:MAG: hypothetical protein LBT00_07155 [Spirochaetaceae bacterium]|nr:hypothetical protein [Spirochaetaceae bacterium]
MRTRRVKQSSEEAVSAGLLRRFAPRNDDARHVPRDAGGRCGGTPPLRG